MTQDNRALMASKGFANPVGFGARPAVLVIDFIKGFTDPHSPLGSDTSAEIEQTNRLISAARSRSIPVFFATIRYDEPHCADAGVWIRKIASLKVLAAETQASELDGRLLWDRNDPVIVKKFASCFFGTDLRDQLRSRGVDTLVLAGCTTSGCVRATAVDACQHGIRAIVAHEAVADRSRAAHDQSLIDINDKYGDVLGVDQIVTALADAGMPALQR